MSSWVDIGADHAYSLYTGRGSDVPIGALVKHPLRDDDETCRWRGACVGSILFRVPEAEPHVTSGGEQLDQWDVISMDPLHVEPSLACHCGDHGFIRNGRWVTA